MESTEIAETIHGHDHAHAAHDPSEARFRKFCGIYLGVVAMLLAIASLGGSNATKQMLNANIHASDTYAFYQAKYIRQTELRATANTLETVIAASPGMPAEARARAEETLKRYRETADRYETDPQAGNGKKELIEKAQEWEHKRDHAALQDPNFEFAEALFQIAIVLGSVAIVAVSRALVGFSAVLAGLACLLTVNGYFLLVHLPFHH